MLHTTSDLTGLSAKTDNESFSIEEICLDPSLQLVAGIVVDTGNLLASRKVFIDRASLGTPDLEAGDWQISATAPAIETLAEITPETETLADKPFASALSDTPVFGTEGEIGQVIDFLVSPDTLDVTGMVLGEGAGLNARQLVVPIGVVRTIPDDFTHIVTDLSRERLAEAPQVEEDPRVKRTFLNAVMTYYKVA